MSSRRGRWRTRFGFYLVAVGSAFALGNLWRFPYVVGENGGGAFVLLYVAVALLIGVPLLIGELMLGHHLQEGIWVAAHRLRNKIGLLSRWAGRMSLLLGLIVLSYYSVISGWVLHFITQYLRGMYLQDVSFIERSFPLLMKQGILQLLLASVHILIGLICIAKGVQEGLEKWISYLMPLFGSLVIILVIQALSVPSAPDVLRFLFYPDFSKLSASSLNQAVGHVFFTLTVGFGTMVTFGSYMKDVVDLPRAGLRVALFDTLISLVALLLLFPVAFQVSAANSSDPAMLFEILPRFMAQIPGGSFFGFIFFLCLYLASLNGTIGLMEVLVSNLGDRLKWERNRAVVTLGFVALALAAVPALSNSLFEGGRWSGQSLIESLDKLVVNWFLPWAALGISLMVQKGVPSKDQEKYFLGQSDDPTMYSMFTHWRFTIRWIVPALICLGFFLQLFV